MILCKVCGTIYQDNSEFCLKCNLPLDKPTNNKPNEHKKMDNYSQLLDEKIKSDFIRDISKEPVKTSLQHVLLDNTNIKLFFDPQSIKGFTNSIGYSSFNLEATIEENTLQFQIFIISNDSIIASTRNNVLKGSVFHIILHFYKQSNLEVVKKQLIGIDKFSDEHTRNPNLVYPIAIIGLQNPKADKNYDDQEKKNNFQIDLENVISKINGLQERFIIKFFDFTHKNVIDFTEIGKFFFERFIIKQKVPKFG